MQEVRLQDRRIFVGEGQELTDSHPISRGEGPSGPDVFMYRHTQGGRVKTGSHAKPSCLS